MAMKYLNEHFKLVEEKLGFPQEAIGLFESIALKIEKNNNFSFPSHLHQCFEIIIILSGEMDVIIDGEKYQCVHIYYKFVGLMSV